VTLGQVGTGTTTLTSLTTNIGNNNAAATTVNVGNTGTSMFGTVNVGMGSTAVNIGTNVGGVVTIGNTGGTAKFNGPITLGSNPPGGSSGSGPYLGSTIVSSATSGTIITSTPTSVNSITLPIGIWIVFGNITTNSFAGNYASASISGSSTAQDNSCLTTIRYSGTTSSNVNVSRGATVAASTATLYLIGQVDTAVAVTNGTLYAIRVG